MNINNIRSTNFQARLDFSMVKTNRARWERIAKQFSEDTKLMPHDNMKVIEHEFDTSIIGYPITEFSEIGKVEAITYNQTMSNLLEKNEDKTIVQKFLKLLNIAEVADSRKEKAFGKYQRLADKNSWIPKDEFTTKRDYEFYKIEEAAYNKVKRDTFLKNFEVIL
jgi:hypothetical protein